jgi:hypothetical protein
VQIVQSLRTNGDMKFDEIGTVIPHLEMAITAGYGDLTQPQPGKLRAFKTHLWWPQVPKSDVAKYIFVLRNPLEARSECC